MRERLNKFFTGPAVRHYLMVMTFAVVVVIVLSVGVYFMPSTRVWQGGAENKMEQTMTSPYARSAPVHLHISKLNLDADFEEPLGLNDDGTVEVPKSPDKVGWYTYGATPGEVGSAVILGHVDTKTGPAIFFYLGQLDEGDEIEVTRADGTTATFVVTDMERVSQDKFPNEEVYGAVNYPALRLITCTGIYDRGVTRYTHNLIVYAELKQE